VPETGERVVAEVVRIGRPEVLVLLNSSRDRLDRNHEIKRPARDWRTALEEAGEEGPLVAANAEEPLIVWVARAARRVVWVDTSSTWSEDTTMCPACGAILTRRHPDPSRDDPGDWDCPACDLTDPDARIRVNGEQIVDADGAVHETRLRVPGRFNVGNAACALAAAQCFGIATPDALEGMRTLSAPAGRFATADFGTTTSTSTSSATTTPPTQVRRACEDTTGLRPTEQPASSSASTAAADTRSSIASTPTRSRSPTIRPNERQCCASSQRPIRTFSRSRWQPPAGRGVATNSRTSSPLSTCSSTCSRACTRAIVPCNDSTEGVTGRA